MRRDCIDCFTDKIIRSRKSVPDHAYLMTEYNCGWRDGMIHDGESKAYAASFAFRTVQQLAGHVQALSWWTFSSIFEEAGLPTDEFGPICFEDGCVFKNGTAGVGARMIFDGPGAKNVDLIRTRMLHLFLAIGWMEYRNSHRELSDAVHAWGALPCLSRL